MGASCISSKGINEKENFGPPQYKQNAMEVVLSTNKSSQCQSSPDRTISQAALTEKNTSKQSSKHFHPSCGLCQQKFNRQAHLPIMLCQQKHTICLACKNMLLATTVQRYRICPWCKAPVDQTSVRTNEDCLKQLQP